jgi:lipoyl-dependent peroxiredoxin
MTTVYNVEALSTGAGRDGRVTTTDGRIDFEMRLPKDLGGSGDGYNPEQLFAAGYAACFHSALHNVARKRGVKLPDSSVGAVVELVHLEGGELRLAVRLEVVIPSEPLDVAQELADAAHLICPYSNATRGNIDVVITVSDD